MKRHKIDHLFISIPGFLSGSGFALITGKSIRQAVERAAIYVVDGYGNNISVIIVIIMAGDKRKYA
jgi:hypothetical protein